MGLRAEDTIVLCVILGGSEMLQFLKTKTHNQEYLLLRSVHWASLGINVNDQSSRISAGMQMFWLFQRNEKN